MPTIKIVPFPGAPGPRGEQGPRGYQGETGLTGPQGEAGVSQLSLYYGTFDNYAQLISVNPTGELGAFAFTEDDGTLYIWNDGDAVWVETAPLKGMQGVPGASAYDIAVANGFDGTEQEWADYLNLIHVVAAEAGQTDQEWLETRAQIPVEIEYSMSGGTLGTQPTFSGDPLFDASYVSNGPLVYFRINVNFSNITSFGNGQYYVILPFNSKYDIFIREGHIYDASTQSSYGISAHVEAGTNQMKLSYTSSNGLDEAFTYNTPILLTTADHFHISGTFIKETA